MPAAGEFRCWGALRERFLFEVFGVSPSDTLFAVGDGGIAFVMFFGRAHIGDEARWPKSVRRTG